MIPVEKIAGGTLGNLLYYFAIIGVTEFFLLFFAVVLNGQTSFISFLLFVPVLHKTCLYLCSYSAFTAQRIFVDLALPFCAHSCMDGRITSLA